MKIVGVGKPVPHSLFMHQRRFHALLRAFHERKGAPILLNASLNPVVKPIVHGVEDPVCVLYTSGLDALVSGNIILEK